MSTTVQPSEEIWDKTGIAVTPPAGHPEMVSRALELSQTLQSTLDIDHIIELFSSEVAADVPHLGVEYRYPDLDLTVALGQRGRHSVRYDLKIDKKNFGSLRFQRDRKFSDEESVALEYLLCNLLYPLRNALMYREAVAGAQRDGLTGTYNRAVMDDAIRREIDIARRHGSELSLIMLDIDLFKNVNDRYGHLIGDKVIQLVADAALECIRSTDMLFRYGGEEFAVMLRNTTREGALRLAERIRQQVEDAALKAGKDKIKVTVTAGVTSLIKDDTLIKLFERADQALYEGKRHGRNRVTAE